MVRAVLNFMLKLTVENMKQCMKMKSFFINRYFPKIFVKIFERIVKITKVSS